MKAWLLYRQRDADAAAEPPPQADALIADLGLELVFAAMAAGDKYLHEVAQKTVLASLTSEKQIGYRQAILADCRAQPVPVRELYDCAVRAIEGERRIWGGWLRGYAEGAMRRAIDVLEIFLAELHVLRRIADQHADAYRSEGLRRFMAMLRQELDDAYLAQVAEHLERLRFGDGLVMSARLGPGNRGSDYVLRRRVGKPGLLERFGIYPGPGYTYEIPPRDEAGAHALRDLRGEGVSLAADALVQSTEHILSFFRQLRWELAFYVGCLNLDRVLAERGGPTCMPAVATGDRPRFNATGLYDLSLRLSMTDEIVGNDVAADGKALVVITGANRGGKSTLLRAIGQGQLMLQAGMFVAAESFVADLRKAIFTHYRREEDETLRSGKLDEELKRMSELVDRVRPGSMVLLNESFASTNEREGSQIAREIVRALLDAGIKVAYVTHLYDLAHGFWRQPPADALFLRAERLDDGTRTFRLVEGEPLPTSFGEDVYRRVFSSSRPTAARPAARDGARAASSGRNG